MSEGKYSKKDAAQDTGSSTKEVSRAWHAARDDAAGSGHLPERNENKTSDSREGGILSSFFSAIGFGPKSDD
jgi:hypothetical protein